MGTLLTVTVVAADRVEAQSMADAAIDEARRWDDALTIWRAEGELARLNAMAGQGPFVVSPRLERGLAAMLDLADATGGAFEPAVGVLKIPGARPVFPLAGIRRVLRLDATRATLEAGNALDSGAIGKGLALEAMVKLLRSRGAAAAFLDFGGSSQTALGAPPGEPEGWTVLVAGWANGVSHGSVRLRDASLSTSRAAAEDTTPILDPRSGAAVPAPRLVTVRTADATDADAWSTALVVLGREGLARAASHGVEVLMEDAGGVVRTPGFGVGGQAEGPGGRAGWGCRGETRPWTGPKPQKHLRMKVSFGMLLPQPPPRHGWPVRESAERRLRT